MVRFKNRYLAVEVNPDRGTSNGPFALHSSALAAAILKRVEQLHGDFGVAAIRTGFNVKYCNQWTRIAMVRIRHGPHRFVASSLPLVNMVGKHRVFLRTMYTGATLRQCYKFIKAHQKSQLEKMWSNLATNEEKKEMEEALMDLVPLLSYDRQNLGS